MLGEMLTTVTGHMSVRWTSPAIPDWTRAAPGALTPSGERAVFRSSPHAWVALRLVYLAEVARVPEDKLAATERRYRTAWHRYVRHGAVMSTVASLIEQNIEAAAAVWNAIDQMAVNVAYTTMGGEKEPFPKINLSTVAGNHFGLVTVRPDTAVERDRKLRPSDHQAAWEAAPGGVCQSSGTPTVSQRHYDQLKRVLPAHPDLFDLSPTYRQTTGRNAPLWRERVALPAKGVADHVIPWAHGGRTAPHNLVNVCAACNYSRNDTSLDVIRVAAYR